MNRTVTDHADSPFWKAGWAAAVQRPSEGFHKNWALEGFADQTVRQIVRVTGSGTSARIKLSNRYGTAPLEVVRRHPRPYGPGARPCRPARCGGSPSAAPIRCGSRRAARSTATPPRCERGAVRLADGVALLRPADRPRHLPRPGVRHHLPRRGRPARRGRPGRVQRDDGVLVPPRRRGAGGRRSGAATTRWWSSATPSPTGSPRPSTATTATRTRWPSGWPTGAPRAPCSIRASEGICCSATRHGSASGRATASAAMCSTSRACARWSSWWASTTSASARSSCRRTGRTRTSPSLNSSPVTATLIGMARAAGVRVTGGDDHAVQGGGVPHARRPRRSAGRSMSGYAIGRVRRGRRLRRGAGRPGRTRTRSRPPTTAATTSTPTMRATASMAAAVDLVAL